MNAGEYLEKAISELSVYDERVKLKFYSNAENPISEKYHREHHEIKRLISQLKQVCEDLRVLDLEPSAETTQSTMKEFYLSDRDIPTPARGIMEKNGFRVLKGSYISSRLVSNMYKVVAKLRQQYAKSIDANNHLTGDLVFDNPGQAARFITGKHINGLREWKTKGGISLKDYQLESKSVVYDNIKTPEILKLRSSNLFIVGQKYSRKDIVNLLKVPPEKTGGNWFTGYTQYNQEYYVFSNIESPGRTGHDYNDHWLDIRELFWRGKNGSHIGQETIKNMMDPKNKVHFFTRNDNKNVDFTYQGVGKVVSYESTIPVQIVWKFEWDTSSRVDEESRSMVSMERYEKKDGNQLSTKNMGNDRFNYVKFWLAAYPAIKKSCSLFDNAKEWDKNYFNGETGYWQVFYKLAIKENEVRAELFLGRYSAKENKALYDELYKHKEEIERAFGQPLIWERLDDNKLSRICVRKNGFNILNESQWPTITQYLINQIVMLSNVFRDPLLNAFNALPWIRKFK